LFSENSRIVTVFNKSIGRSSGLVHGVKTPIQQGDVSNVSWRGRIIEQLGKFKIENIFSPFVHVFNNHLKIFMIESACTLCRIGLPERAPHPRLFDILKTLFFSITHENWIIDYIFFEIAFLSEIGAGLDLSKCAVTGTNENLYYISPRTGHAVTKAIGEKYKNRLFRLPKFMILNEKNPTHEDILCALKITEHFLKAYFCDISRNKLPLSRNYLITELGEKSRNLCNEN
jgi:DNA repair protein RecO (recombination protein O)